MKAHTVWQHRLQLLCFFTFISYTFITGIASENFVPDLADYINHLALLIQAKFAMNQGQFPLRIAPLEQHGFGYPVYQFFSPTGYWLGAIIYNWVTPNNPMIAFKLTIWLGLISGGIFMYRLAFWFVQSRFASMLAGLVYIAAPYYIIIINRLGNFNEAIALGILPAAVFYSLQRFYHPQKKSFLVLTALVWYLLITVHMITFIYTAAVTGLMLIGLTLQNPKQLYNLIQTGIAVGFACLLAMWFLAPIANFSTAFLLSSTFTTPEHISYYHPLLSHLLFPAAAISPEFNNGIMRIHPAVGWPILVAAVICFYAYFHQQDLPERSTNRLLPILLTLFTCTFLLAWSPINLWQFLPKVLSVGQYSWRILSQVIWLGALLFAWACMWVFKNKISLEQFLAMLFIIIISATPWFPNIQNAHTTGPSKIPEILTLNTFKKDPTQLYNRTSFLLDFNNHPEFTSEVDSLLMDPDNILKLTTPFHLSGKVLAFARHPYVFIEGNLSNSIGKSNQITVSLDNKLLTKKKLVPGPFHWEIPLDKLPQNQNRMLLQFDLTDKSQILTGLQMTKVLLMGFQNPATTLRVAAVKDQCRRNGSATNCRIQVNKQINLIELPILFYPQMLNATLNGKPVPVEGILHEGTLYAAIKAEPNKLNVINVEFTGLRWANLVSRASWGFWGFLVLFIAGERLLRRQEFS